MTSIGELLLLVHEYKMDSKQTKHTLYISMDKSTKTILHEVAKKLDGYSDSTITKASLARALISFGIHYLKLQDVTARAEPLASLPENSKPRREVQSMENFADVLGLSSEDLCNLDPVHLGAVIDLGS